MSKEHITLAFSMLVEEFEHAIHEVNKEGANAFAEKQYEAIPILAQKAKDLESFQSRIVALEDEWSSISTPARYQKDKRGKWTRQALNTPVSFHKECIDRVAAHLKMDFIKQTRSSFISRNGKTALVVSVSREHDKGSYNCCWFSFHTYNAEFLAAKPNGYLMLGCGSPDKILLIPFSDFAQWIDKLNKSTKADESYYSHIKIITDNGGFRLILEGRGNQVDIAKYQLK